MASANISLSAEQFLCPICLNVFTEPVTTPCGHNYCKDCINSFWALSDVSQCPLCKEEFQKAPELRVNTEFREMLELFKRTTVAGEDSSLSSGPGEVPCDLCHGMKRKALKSCLVCLASYCSAHLEPHHRVPALKWHKLINPVKTLEDRVCKKHNKVMEFFCRKDQSCICILCLREDHVMHETISLEEELRERKTKLKCKKRQGKQILSRKCIVTQKIQNSMMKGRQEVERTKAETVKAFTALVALIETKKEKLIELLEENQKAAEQQAKALIRQLQLEIEENHQTSTKLEELSKTEDDFRLLQCLPSISPSNAKQRFTARVCLLDVVTVRRVVAKVEKTLTDQMEKIIREVSLVDKVEEPMQSDNVDDELGRIQKRYATEVTLDPNTAHPSLVISEDQKQVKDGGTKRKVPDNPTRFDSLHYVLGNEGFSTGRFYYEVTLIGQTRWVVGVARESISRKGDWSLSPENGCWTLASYSGHCQANIQKVGVFVDYEGELVSFYDLDARVLIYSFTGCAFTESAPSLSYSFTPRIHSGIPAKTRIYPLFRPSAYKGSDSAPLQITAVRCTKGK